MSLIHVLFECKPEKQPQCPTVTVEVKIKRLYPKISYEMSTSYICTNEANIMGNGNSGITKQLPRELLQTLLKNKKHILI